MKERTMLPENTPDANRPDGPAPDGQPRVSDERLAAVREALLAWYAAHGRDLPWRRTRDPYSVLLSETMLQQTQVPRVLPRYLAWLERFPTLAALAAAPTADVLRAWSGLGYNSRAVRLQAVARHAVAHNGGRLPGTVEELLALPGIGAYTARAVACFAYGQDVPVLDTNVKRVLHRALVGLDLPRPALTERQLWALAERAVPTGRGYDWNQGLMDLGAQICTARKPACVVCPLRPHCRAAPAIQGALADGRRAARQAASPAVPFTKTARHYRGQTLRALGALGRGERLTLDALGPLVRPDYTAADRPWLYALVAGLARDGLVAVTGETAAGGRQPAVPPGPSPPGEDHHDAPSCSPPGLGGPGGAAFVREERAPYDVAPEPDLAAVRVSLPES